MADGRRSHNPRTQLMAASLAVEHQIARPVSWPDLLVVLLLTALLGGAVALARHSEPRGAGPAISLAPRALPYYAGLSVLRMLAAYVLSLVFSIPYGYAAARSKRGELVLLPVLDVLQSVPILSFLPAVVLSLCAVLPERVAVELAAVILIFTSQAWNLTFAWYQALTTVPNELLEAATTFRFNGWLLFKTVQAPFAALSLIWNSMMSWAGGWFFLMAAEMFTVGDQDFRLPGLGTYLKEAADQGDARAVLVGLAVLLSVIVALDQLVWRPLLAWAERFKLATVAGEEAPTSWFYAVLRDARLLTWVRARLRAVFGEAWDQALIRWYPMRASVVRPATGLAAGSWLLPLVLGALAAVGLWFAVPLLARVSAPQWREIAAGLVATGARVACSLLLALLWTIPVGVAIGTKPRAARWMQPLVQMAASVPATALFPVLLLLLLKLPGGLNLASVLLMLAGTQWYLLFNIIAGAAAIPQDLRDTASLLQLSGAERWRTLVLPSLAPFIVTGAITASGGAWNASIVAEYVTFGGQTHATLGAGATIARATAQGQFPLLLAATLAMVATVIVINRLLWRRLYRLAAERFRME